MNVKINSNLFKGIVLALMLIVLVVGQAYLATGLDNPQSGLPAQVVQGSGNFPRLVVAAPAKDGVTLAVYLIEGSTATEVAVLDKTLAVSHRVDLQLSLDGKSALCLRTAGPAHQSILEVIDLQSGQRTIIDQSAEAATRHDPREALTRAIWAGDRLIYSKVKMQAARIEPDMETVSSPLSVVGEVWEADAANPSKKQLLASLDHLYRVIGSASPLGAQKLYVTYLVDGRESDLIEGMGVLDEEQGTLEKIWPSPDTAQKTTEMTRYHAFKVIRLPDGTDQVMFVTAEDAQTVLTQPPGIWIGDPFTHNARLLWTIDQGKDIMDKLEPQTLYDLPEELYWPPDEGQDSIIYRADGSGLGGLWLVDLASRQSKRLADTGYLVSWKVSGEVVIQDEDSVRLLVQKKESFQVEGEIRLPHVVLVNEADAVANAVVNWKVPYIHQKWDTPDWFCGGLACGPSCAVMGMAYFTRLIPHPIVVHYPVPCTHTSLYGWYVSSEYTFRSAFLGSNTFNRVQKDACGNPAKGAYGAIMYNKKAWAWRIQEYAKKHDVGNFFDAYPISNEQLVKDDLLGGGLVILSTQLTGNGHLVLVRGYTQDGRYIVNDPHGYKQGGVYDTCDNGDCNHIHCGEEVLYTWSEMSPNWYIALYGPEFMPEIRKNATWDGTISIRNGYCCWPAFVNVAYMNTNGSRNTTRSKTIPANGAWYLNASSVFSSNFYGSAIVMPYQTSVSSVNLTNTTNKTYDYSSIHSAMAGMEVNIPGCFCNYYGWRSILYVQNTGGLADSTTITVKSYNVNGSEGPSQKATVKAWGRAAFNLCFAGAPSNGSVRVTASQPLAAVVLHTHDTMDYFAQEGSSRPDTGHCLPSLMKNFYTWMSSYQIQEVAGRAVNGKVCYYPGYYCRNFSLSPRSKIEVYMGAEPLYDGLYSASIQVTGGNGRVLSLINHASEGGGALGYPGFAQRDTGRRLALPRLRKAFDGWDSSITVKNVGTSSTSVRLNFFDLNGVQKGNSVTRWLAPKEHVLLYGEIPSFKGSVEIISYSADVAVLAHEANGVRNVGYNALVYGAR